MLSSVFDGAGSLRILEGQTVGQDRWSGALAHVFDIGREVLRRVYAEVRWGRLRGPAFLSGSADQFGLLPAAFQEVAADYPLELVSPFEGTTSIAGGLWSGRELFGDGSNDALAKLRFDRGTLDLPMHGHEFSERFILVAEGSGRFHWSRQGLDCFDGTQMRSVSVSSGDVLIFTRGLMHTFSAPSNALLLLSYHSPEIAFDDPRQYTLPRVLWTPRSGLMQ